MAYLQNINKVYCKLQDGRTIEINNVESLELTPSNCNLVFRDFCEKCDKCKPIIEELQFRDFKHYTLCCIHADACKRMKEVLNDNAN